MNIGIEIKYETELHTGNTYYFTSSIKIIDIENCMICV
jgi:hypothetical protein